MSVRPRLAALALALLAACDAPAPTATDAAVALKPEPGRQYRIEIPSETSFPFYARSERDPDGVFGYRTDAWAALVFYRDPAGIPDDFDLFRFVDVPGAFFVPTTVRGFGIFGEPLGITEPRQSRLTGDAVPIWFVRATAFAGLAADGVLTMAELEALPPSLLRRGTATRFSEVAHTILGHPRPRISITAAGTLAGGGTFRYSVVWNGVAVSERRQITIDIDP
jgi:hypothetical protein